VQSKCPERLRRDTHLHRHRFLRDLSPRAGLVIVEIVDAGAAAVIVDVDALQGIRGDTRLPRLRATEEADVRVSGVVCRPHVVTGRPLVVRRGVHHSQRPVRNPKRRTWYSA